jgi:hypothetical protein
VSERLPEYARTHAAAARFVVLGCILLVVIPIVAAATADRDVTTADEWDRGLRTIAVLFAFWELTAVAVLVASAALAFLEPTWRSTVGLVMGGLPVALLFAGLVILAASS